MFVGLTLPSSNELFVSKSYARVHQCKLFRTHKRAHQLNVSLSSHASRQDIWSLSVSGQINRPLYHIPHKYCDVRCKSFVPPEYANPVLKSAASSMSRSYNALRGYPLLLQLLPAFGVVAFTLWGLEPLIRHSRILFFRRSDANWKKSRTHYVYTSYLRPLLLWGGANLFCRALDPVILTSEASQIVKQRLLHFVRSLSTVLAFSFCLSSLIQQVQKILMETNDNSDARNMGFQFAGKAVYTAVWIAAVSLFMELLGFSTQKWLTAGGLGTVLLTLAGREIFTNFLSSIMIHATRPFVFNEWIQTKIEGYEVSGTVEQVGWWSPTIIRGEDREAIHIPNHKFTVNVVRNLSQKTHWRVKTHLAISHLDAHKINNIVADMRKVLAKNPQVEQQRLHRRVFLEYINTENQAFMILISCFIKTSHFEEYLCVKEAILLDLLRVISHHRARLATPIRTVQKIYSDAELENIPFADTIFTRTKAPVRGPLYLIDSTSRINGDDKSRGRTTPRVNEESLKAAVSFEQNTIDHVSEGSASDKKRQQKVPNSGNSTIVSEDPLRSNLEEKQMSKKTKSGDTHVKTNISDRSTTPTSNSSSKSHPQGLHASEAASSVKSSDEALPTITNTKNETEKLLATPKSTTKPSLEENIILGVALDGAKRTLPIDEMEPSPTAEAELTAVVKGKGNGNGSALPTKDTKDGQTSTTSDGTSAEQQDPEKS